MTKIVYRDQKDGYYNGRAPDEPARMGLRKETRSCEQSFCRGIERERQSAQRCDTYTEDDFDMYRNDAPHRRTASRRGPSKSGKKEGKLPLWIICSLISAVGLFLIFSNILSVKMLGLQIGSFSTFDILLGKGSNLCDYSDIVNPKITAVTAAAFAVSLFLFLRCKENSFDKIIPVLLLSAIPAGVMVYFMYGILNAPPKAIWIDVGLGVFLQIICSAGLIVTSLIGYSMTSKNGSRKNVSYRLR